MILPPRLLGELPLHLYFHLTTCHAHCSHVGGNESHNVWLVVVGEDTSKFTHCPCQGILREREGEGVREEAGKW